MAVVAERTGSPAVRVTDFERYASMVTVVAIFIPTPFSTRISVGAVLAIVFLRSILRRLEDNRPARFALGGVVLVYTCGVITALFSLLLSNRTFNGPYFVNESLVYLNIATTLAAALWASTANGVVKTALLVGIAGSISGMVLITPDQAPNPWKYVLAWPVSILVVALIDRAPTFIAVTALLALATVSLRLDSRNAAGSLVITALVILIMRRRVVSISPGRVAIGLLTLGGIVAGAFVVLTALIGAGVFGTDLAQLQARQNAIWILGSRVEPFVTAGYFLNSPMGIGLGVVPSPTDIQSAQSWFAISGAPSGTVYVTTRLFGPEVNLHSVLASFWYDAGLVGAAVGIVFFWILLRGIIASPRHRALVVFVGSQGIWDLLFSPIDGNGRWVAIALAIVIVCCYAPAEAPQIRRRARQDFVS